MLLAVRTVKPAYSTTMVDRPRLYRRLDAWRDARAVIIHAPAGYGKSSLVSRWLDVTHMASQAVWLTLDESYADPHQFVHHVAAAFSGIIPNALELVLPILNDTRGRPERAWVRLLAGIDASVRPEGAGRDVILVLDDLHRVQSPEVDTLLATLLEAGPPHMHLFLLARRRTGLALARLHAHGQLLALNADDLRFTEDEIISYLLKHGFAPPSAAEVAQLASHSEGWVTALQLAALATHQRTGVSALIGEMQGNRGWLAEFLLDEVLHQVAPELCIFMLQTSILDQFDAALCAAVTQDAEAYARLDTIVRADLFLIRLDDDEGQFRYHHLFQQLLQHRLSATVPTCVVPQLHRRAAEWLATQGQIATAIRHLLLAGAEDEAAALAERGLRQTLVQDPHRAKGLLALVPSAVMTRRPQLMLDRCLLGVLLDDQHTLAYVDEAAHAVQAQQVPEARRKQFQAELLVLRMVGAFILRDLDAARVAGRQVQSVKYALNDLYFGTFQFVQMHLYGYQGMRAEMVKSAEMGLAAFVRDGFAAGIVALRRELAKWSMRVGSSDEASRLFRVLCNALDRTQYPALREWVFAFSAAAENSYLLDQLEQALSYQGAAVELALLLDDPALVQGLGAVEALMRGNCQPIEQLVDAWHKTSKDIVSANASDAFLARQMQLLVAAGQHDLAWRLLQATGIRLDTMPTDRLFSRLAAYLWATIGHGVDLEGVAPVLERVLEDARQRGDRLHQLRLLALTAWQQWKLGRAASAEIAVDEALQLAHTTGYVRVLLDIPDLALMLQETGLAGALVYPSASCIIPVSDSETLLTAQEQRVLALLAADCTYQQIAAELVVSVNTVRSHVRNLYKKFNVRRRDQAIAAARRLGMKFSGRPSTTAE